MTSNDYVAAELQKSLRGKLLGTEKCQKLAEKYCPIHDPECMAYVMVASATELEEPNLNKVAAQIYKEKKYGFFAWISIILFIIQLIMKFWANKKSQGVLS